MYPLKDALDVTRSESFGRGGTLLSLVNRTGTLPRFRGQEADWRVSERHHAPEKLFDDKCLVWVPTSSRSDSTT